MTTGVKCYCALSISYDTFFQFSISIQASEGAWYRDRRFLPVKKQYVSSPYLAVANLRVPVRVGSKDPTQS